MADKKKPKEPKQKAKKIGNMTEEELAEFIQNTVRGNHIELSGICVNSTAESLKTVEQTINRLIKKHKDFLLLKKEQAIRLGGDNYLG